MSSPYLTDWERREHDRDNGRTAAIADALEHAARIIREPHPGLVAASTDQYLFAMTGTPQERRAYVDAWADARHVTDRYTDPETGYCARLRVGQMCVVAIAVPVSEPAGLDAPQDAREDVPELAVA